ncbi:MAG: helix-turn-helix domain-containing protein [Oscillospiraceae bacterium]
MELSKLLKELRVSMGMTQMDIARALHLSFSTVNRWENDRARPNRLACVTILSLAKDKYVPEELLCELEIALFGDTEKER